MDGTGGHLAAAAVVGAAAGAVGGGLAAALCCMRQQQQPCVPMASGGSFFTLRVPPGVDMIHALEAAVRERGCRACAVVSCVGSVARARVRLATEIVAAREECFEIVALSGTMEFAPASTKPSRITRHLHIALADRTGAAWGGHVLSDAAPNLPVHTTAEICVVALHDEAYTREHCDRSGWPELVVTRRAA